MTFEEKKGVCKGNPLGTGEDHPNGKQVQKSLIHAASIARVAACSMPCFPVGSCIFTSPQFLVKTGFNSPMQGSRQCEVGMTTSTVFLWESVSQFPAFWPAGAKLK